MDRIVAGEKRYDGEIAKKVSSMGWANTNDLEFVTEVDSVVSATQAISFADQPWFNISGKDLDPDREHQAAASQAVIEKQTADMDFEGAAVDLMDDWALHGTCIAGDNWMFRERYAGLPGGNVLRIPYIDRPDLKKVPLWRFSFEVGSTEVQTAEWVCEEEEMNEDQLDALVLMAEKMGNALFKKRSQLSLEGATLSSIGNEMSDAIANARKTPVTERKKYTVKKYFGRHPLDKEKPFDYLIVIVNNSDWLIQAPNMYHHGLKPYEKAVFKKKTEAWYGRGLNHRLANAHDEMNERTNLMTDLCTLALMGTYFQEGGSALEADRLKVKPGGIYSQSKWGRLTPWPANIGALAPAQGMQNTLRERMRGASGARTRTRSLHDRALGLLAVRPRSRRELQERLVRAGFDDMEVSDEIDRLTSVGLVDDLSFARGLVEPSVRGCGGNRLRQER